MNLFAEYLLFILVAFWMVFVAARIINRPRKENLTFKRLKNILWGLRSVVFLGLIFASVHGCGDNGHKLIREGHLPTGDPRWWIWWTWMALVVLWLYFGRLTKRWDPKRAALSSGQVINTKPSASLKRWPRLKYWALKIRGLPLVKPVVIVLGHVALAIGSVLLAENLLKGRRNYGVD